MGMALAGCVFASMKSRDARADAVAEWPATPEGPIDSSEVGTRVGSVSGFVGWAFNVPLGSASAFTKNASLFGLELQLSFWPTRRISLGVSTDWAIYMDSSASGTAARERGSAALAYNQLQTWSLRLLAHYAVLGQPDYQPYIGPLVGVSWAAFDREVGNVRLSDTASSINVGGELGIIMPFEIRGPAAIVNLRYSMSPTAGFRSIVSNVQSIGLLLGIGF